VTPAALIRKISAQPPGARHSTPPGSQTAANSAMAMKSSTKSRTRPSRPRIATPQPSKASAPSNPASPATEPPFRAVMMAASPRPRLTRRMATPRRIGGIEEKVIASALISTGSGGL
jgi:hypothetical protein